MSEELDTELVEFKITLSGTYDNDPPKYQVLLDGQVIDNGILVEKEQNGEEKIVAFSKEMDEGEHILQVRLLGKENRHTVIDENNNITSDQLLNIKQVEIDEIELDYLFYSLGKYHKQINPIDAIEPLFDAEPLQGSFINLGWNGEWRLKFTVPTYMWFLENL